MRYFITVQLFLRLFLSTRAWMLPSLLKRLYRSPLSLQCHPLIHRSDPLKKSLSITICLPYLSRVLILLKRGKSRTKLVPLPCSAVSHSVWLSIFFSFCSFCFSLSSFFLFSLNVCLVLVIILLFWKLLVRLKKWNIFRFKMTPFSSNMDKRYFYYGLGLQKIRFRARFFSYQSQPLK